MIAKWGAGGNTVIAIVSLQLLLDSTYIICLSVFITFHVLTISLHMLPIILTVRRIFRKSFYCSEANHIPFEAKLPFYFYTPHMVCSTLCTEETDSLVTSLVFQNLVESTLNYPLNTCHYLN